MFCKYQTFRVTGGFEKDILAMVCDAVSIFCPFTSPSSISQIPKRKKGKEMSH